MKNMNYLTNDRVEENYLLLWFLNNLTFVNFLMVLCIKQSNNNNLNFY